MKRIVVLILLLTVPAAATPSYQALKRAGDRALAHKQYEKAIRTFEVLVRDYSGSAAAHNALGFACYQAGRIDRALYQFRQALRLDRSNAEAQHNFILAVGTKATDLTRHLQFNEALKLLDEVIADYSWHPELAIVYYYKGLVLFYRGDQAAALKAWRQAARRDPRSATAGFLKALAAERAGHPKAAGRMYQRAIQRVPHEPVFRNYYGRMLERLGKSQRALSQYLKAATVPQPPPYVDLYLGQAQVYRRLGDYDKAARALRKARDIRPDYASVHLLLWADYLQGGFADAARDELGLAVAADRRPGIAVFSNTAGATVDLDGRDLGATPTAAFTRPGKHQVTLRSAGKVFNRSVDLASGELLSLRFDGQTMSLSRQKRPTTVGGRKPAPNIVLKDRSNRRWRLARYLHHSPVVLLFWSASSPGAAQQLAQLSALGSQFQGKVETAAIHVDPRLQRKALRLLLASPANFAQLWGNRHLLGRFGLDSSALPGVVLVGTGGYIDFARSGPEALHQVAKSLSSSLGTSH